MNNAKLCVAVILLSVICPVIVGYAWPVDQSTVINYEVGSPTNITNDMMNGDIGVFNYYTDIYNNNMNVYWTITSAAADLEDERVFLNEPLVTSASASPIPDIQGVFEEMDISVHTLSHTYTIDPYTFWNLQCPDDTVVVWDVQYPDDTVTVTLKLATDNIQVQRVIYYPLSDVMIYITEDQTAIRPADYQAIVYTYTANGDYTIAWAHATEADYADLKYGFKLPAPSGGGLRGGWYNGFNNAGIDILFDMTDNIGYSAAYMTFGSTSIVVDVYQDIVRLAVTQNGQTTVESLGSADIYPFALLRIDTYSEKIELSGLRGMTSMLDDYQGKIRHTLTVHWDDADDFTTFQIHGSVGPSGHMAWFVPRTISDIGTVRGMVDATIDPIGYGGYNVQLQLRAVQLHPIDNYAVMLTLNGVDSWYGRVDVHGNLYFPYPFLGNEPYNLNNLIIAIIDNTVYINGQPIIEYGTDITSADIVFYGDWLMSVYLFPISEVPGKAYAWAVGGFGLDVSGFCTVGLMTSGGSCLAASLYGRRSGAKVALVALTAAICAVVYLIVLMGGL